jgi:hypothetical protein
MLERCTGSPGERGILFVGRASPLA